MSRAGREKRARMEIQKLLDKVNGVPPRSDEELLIAFHSKPVKPAPSELTEIQTPPEASAE